MEEKVNPGKGDERAMGQNTAYSKVEEGDLGALIGGQICEGLQRDWGLTLVLCPLAAYTRSSKAK